MVKDVVCGMNVDEKTEIQVRERGQDILLLTELQRRLWQESRQICEV